MRMLVVVQLSFLIMFLESWNMQLGKILISLLIIEDSHGVCACWPHTEDWKQILVFFGDSTFGRSSRVKKCMYLRCVAVCFHLHFMETFCVRELLLTKSSKWSWRCLALQGRTSKGSQDFHRLDEGSLCQCLLTLNHYTKLQKAHQLWRGWIYIGNYICALFLLKTISAFGCGLLASGVGIGY